jgi:uncharacterized membrane protein YphA (DoxX/SURF4 family)
MRRAIQTAGDTAVLEQGKSLDTGLLLLRIGAGLSLLLMFGVPKLRDAVHFIRTAQPWSFVEFNRRLGLPLPTLVAYCQTLNESVGALCVAAGLLFRIASVALALGFAVATYCSERVHESSWVLASAYCLMFATLVLTGPGKFSIDRLRALRGDKSF